MADKSVLHTLATRSKCTKSLAFDPKGDFLSAVDDTGVVTVWALKAIKAGRSLKTSTRPTLN
jgi:chromosome transmission fidelity protein 4